jgi:hypothetical protein
MATESDRVFKVLYDHHKQASDPPALQRYDRPGDGGLHSKAKHSIAKQLPSKRTGLIVVPLTLTVPSRVTSLVLDSEGPFNVGKTPTTVTLTVSYRLPTMIQDIVYSTYCMMVPRPLSTCAKRSPLLAVQFDCCDEWRSGCNLTIAMTDLMTTGNDCRQQHKKHD